jgi:hypothetical protein
MPSARWRNVAGPAHSPGSIAGWYYRRNWTAQFDAAFVKLLNTAAWMPASSGELERPEFVLFDQLRWNTRASDAGTDLRMRAQ